MRYSGYAPCTLSASVMPMTSATPKMGRSTSEPNSEQRLRKRISVSRTCAIGSLPSQQQQQQQQRTRS